ncbi:MAG: hypothetical protein IIA55_14785 [Gemmatimonadetes bacterium]|nr:hypothetical protein [Gemmatimonadota bacterium]
MTAEHLLLIYFLQSGAQQRARMRTAAGRLSDSRFGRAAGLPVVIPANRLAGMMGRLIPNVCAYLFDRLPAD